MRIPALALVEQLRPGQTYELRQADFTGADRSLPYAHAMAMCYAGEIEGVATGSGRIRYLRILSTKEREQVAKPEPPQSAAVRARSAHIAPALITQYREKVGEYSVRTLCKITGHGFGRWREDEGFNPFRFNPDRIPAPILPGYTLGAGRPFVRIGA